MYRVKISWILVITILLCTISVGTVSAKIADSKESSYYDESNGYYYDESNGYYYDEYHRYIYDPSTGYTYVYGSEPSYYYEESPSEESPSEESPSEESPSEESPSEESPSEESPSETTPSEVTPEGMRYWELEDGSCEIINYEATSNIARVPKEINGKKVSKIGISAFSDSQDLQYIKIPNNITEIDMDAFIRCSNLTLYVNMNSYAETFAKNNGMKFKYIGDINKDDDVSIIDATQLQLSLANLVSGDSIDPVAASVLNNDEDLSYSIVDALQLQKYLANLVDEL